MEKFKNLSGANLAAARMVAESELLSANIPVIRGRTTGDHKPIAIGVMKFAAGQCALFTRESESWCVWFKDNFDTEAFKKLTASPSVSGQTLANPPQLSARRWSIGLEVSTEQGLSDLPHTLLMAFDKLDPTHSADYTPPKALLGDNECWFETLALAGLDAKESMFLPYICDQVEVARKKFTALRALARTTSDPNLRRQYEVDALRLTAIDTGRLAEERSEVISALLFMAEQDISLHQRLRQDSRANGGHAYLANTLALETTLNRKHSLLIENGQRNDAEQLKRKCELLRLELFGLYDQRRKVLVAEFAALEAEHRQPSKCNDPIAAESRKRTEADELKRAAYNLAHLIGRMADLCGRLGHSNARAELRSEYGWYGLKLAPEVWAKLDEELKAKN